MSWGDRLSIKAIARDDLTVQKMTDSKKDKSIFHVGDRVFAKPYNCNGTVVKVEWQDELKLRLKR